MKSITIRPPDWNRSTLPETGTLKQTNANLSPGKLRTTVEPQQSFFTSLPNIFFNAIATTTENQFPRASTGRETARPGTAAHSTPGIHAGVTTGPGGSLPQNLERMPSARTKQKRRLAQEPSLPGARAQTQNAMQEGIGRSENAVGARLKTGQPDMPTEALPATTGMAGEILANISNCLENLFDCLERDESENGFHHLQLFCQEVQRYSRATIDERSHPAMASSIEMQTVALKSRSYFESREKTGPYIQNAAWKHLFAFHEAMKNACEGFEDAPKKRKQLEWAATLTGMVLNQAQKDVTGYGEKMTERQILAVIDATGSETEVVGNDGYRMEELSSSDTRVLTQALLESLRPEENAELHRMIDIEGRETVINAIFESDIDRQITVIDGEHLGPVFNRSGFGDRLDDGKRQSLTRADAAIRKCCGDDARQAETVMQLCCQNSGTTLITAISSNPSLRGLLQLKDGRIQIDTDRSALLEWLTGETMESIQMPGVRSTYNISSRTDGSVAVKMTFKNFDFSRILRVTADENDDSGDEEDGLRMTPVDIEPADSSFRLELEFVVKKNGDIRAGRPPRIHASGTVAV